MFRNRQQLEADAINGFERLYDIVTDRSYTKLAYKPKHVTALKQITIKFNENTFLKINKIIGEGFWSFVFLAQDCNDGTEAPRDVVLKILRPSHPDVIRNSMHTLGQIPIDPKKQFVKEAGIYREYFRRYGDVIIRKVRNLEICALIMPFLGNITITKLIADPFYLTHIPLEEWLDFMKDCVMETRRLHLTGYLHYDLKPSNFITTPTQIDGTCTFKLTGTTPIDCGNARSFSKTGTIGDFRYAPLIRSFVGLFYSFGTPTVDQYALGKTLLDIIFVLKNLKSFKHPQIRAILKQCQTNAESLVSQTNPAPLEDVAKEFQRIKDNYNNAEKCQFIHLSTELEQLRAKLDTKVKMPTNCCMPVSQNVNGLFNKSPPVPIKQTIEAIDKLLLLIAGEEVEFTAEDMQAYKEGELGDIITHFRLEGNLPPFFNEIERRSFSISL